MILKSLQKEEIVSKIEEVQPNVTKVLFCRKR